MALDKETMSIYLEGANELLNEMEEAILHLSDSPDDMNEINRLFRVMHSLKGSSAMVELNDVADFAHKLESECDHFRQGKAMVNEQFLKLVLKSHDQIKILIFSHFDGEPADNKVSQILINEIQKIRSGSTGKSFDFENEEERLTRQLSFLKEKFSLAKNFEVDELPPLSLEMTKFVLLSRRLQKESVSEFVEPFEKFLRDCKKLKLRLSKEATELFNRVIDETYRMLREGDTEIEAADFSPEALLMSLQIPLELKENLAQIKKEMKFPEARLPEEKEFFIRLSALDEYSSLFNPQALIEAISLLGRVRREETGLPVFGENPEEEGSENELSN